MIRLEDHPEGIVLAVKAHAGARRDEIRGEHDGAVKISVTQAPEKGKANDAIADLLAKQLGLRRTQVQLLSGATNPHKKFLLRGILKASVLEKLTT